MLKGKTLKDKTPLKDRALKRLLIYEKKNGKPIFYKNYREVLEGKKIPESLIGSGFLQGLFVQLLAFFLKGKLGADYLIATNEVGFKYSKGSWYNLDLAVWRKEDFKTFPTGYVSVPPLLVVEVDTKVDLEDFERRFGMDYITAKTQDLLDSGVKKVIWITTSTRKILVAEKDKPWQIVDWNYPVELWENITLRLEELIKKELGGVNF